MNRPSISVIIPTYRDTRDAQLTLSRLVPQIIPGDELLVIDNGPADQQQEVLALLQPEADFRVLHCPVRGSYAARNLGASAARGSVLAFTDAGCIVGAEWLAAIRRHFSQDLAPRLSGPILMTYGGGRPTASALVDEKMHLHQHRYVGEGWAATANLAIRRSAFEMAGGFDQRLFSGGDREFGVRCTLAGLPIAWSTDMSIEHEARSTLRALLAKRRRVLEGAHLLERQPRFKADLMQAQRLSRPCQELQRRPRPPIGTMDLIGMKIVRLIVDTHDRRYRGALRNRLGQGPAKADPSTVDAHTTPGRGAD